MLNASYLDLKARLLSSRGRVRRDASHYSGAIEDFSSSLKQMSQHSEFATNVRNDLFYVLLLVVANRLGVSIDLPEKEPEKAVPLLLGKIRVLVRQLPH